MAAAPTAGMRVQGEMLKQGHVRKSWKRRFFVLDIEKRTVQYFSDRSLSAKTKKGEFSIVGAQIDPVSASVRRNNQKGGDKQQQQSEGERANTSLKVKTKSGKEYWLECAHPGERDEWVTRLRFCASAEPDWGSSAVGKGEGQLAPIGSSEGAETTGAVGGMRRKSYSVDALSGTIVIDAFLAEGADLESAMANVRVSAGSFISAENIAGANDQSFLATAAAGRVAKTGFLDKKGQLNRQWKRRWFALSDAPGTSTIAYYKHGGGIELKGEILLDPRQTVVEDHPTIERPACFSVQTITKSGSTKTILLSSESAVDSEEWIDAISRALSVSVVEERKTGV